MFFAQKAIHMCVWLFVSFWPTFGVNYELVHATRAQGCPDEVDHRQTCIDVGEELRLSLAGIGALFQQNDLWALQKKSDAPCKGRPNICLYSIP